MPKKMDQGPHKKECPSCGLGVALESTICEFCGWDFEEEDEWILQIEKLERELMLEKQKFEPGTVNHMIESTLRNPVLEKIESAQTAAREEASPAPKAEKASASSRAPAPAKPVQEPRRIEPAPVPEQKAYQPPPKAPAPPPAQITKQTMKEVFEELEIESTPKVRRVRSVKAPAPGAEAPVPRPDEAPKPMPVRTLKASPEEKTSESEPSKKTRVVRKVKG